MVCLCVTASLLIQHVTVIHGLISDHFVLSIHLLTDIPSASNIEIGCNLSDHNHIMIELDVSCILDDASAGMFNTTCDKNATTRSSS